MRAVGLGAVGSSVAVAGCLGGSNDEDDGYPDGSQTIELIVPFAEGGGVDTYGREIMSQLSDTVGNPTQVDNVEGSATLRAAGELYNADTDGYTIGAFNPPATPLADLVHEHPEDLQEFTPILSYSRGTYALLADPEYEIESVDDMADRIADGEIEHMGGQQAGEATHVISMIMRDEWDIPWEEYIGYPGAGPLAEALAGGEVPVAVGAETGVEGAVNDDQVDLVAILASEGGTIFEDAPTITDEGYPEIDYIANFWRGYWFPPGTPDEYVDAMSDALMEVLESPEMEEWSDETGLPIEPQDTEFTQDFYDDAYEQIPETVDLDEVRDAAED